MAGSVPTVVRSSASTFTRSATRTFNCRFSAFEPAITSIATGWAKTNWRRTRSQRRPRREAIENVSALPIRFFHSRSVALSCQGDLRGRHGRAAGIRDDAM